MLVIVRVWAVCSISRVCWLALHLNCVDILFGTIAAAHLPFISIFMYTKIYNIFHLFLSFPQFLSLMRCKIELPYYHLIWKVRHMNEAAYIQPIPTRSHHNQCQYREDEREIEEKGENHTL